MGGLTAARVRAISEPGWHGDGDTLYLAVAPGGSKSWVQRLTINSARRDLGLGGYPLVSLAEARRLAFENRKVARDGGDPIAAKRKLPTFREVARIVYESRKKRWRSAKVKKNWWQQMERHAFPVLGDMRVDQIGPPHVLRVLDPIWTVAPETGRRIRRHIRATLAWCVAREMMDKNAAGPAIDGGLESMPLVKEHYRALPHSEVAGALRIIEDTGASIAAKLCLRFLVLTAARSGEARGARWEEVESKRWTVPAARMKGRKEHRVPLSDTALAVLAEARILEDGSGLVFPSPVKRGKPLSDMTLTKLLRDTGFAHRATVHGFRSSFRDWCAESWAPREVAEAALAHAVGGVEGAYLHSDFFERRRPLMDEWARYLSNIPEKGAARRG